MADSDSADDECGEVDEQDRDTHWVHDLFPPSFKLSLQQLVLGSVTTRVLDKHGQQLTDGPQIPTRENNEEIFAKLARRISPLDVDAIKNVYQRVWLMMSNDELAKENEKQQETEAKLQDAVSSRSPQHSDSPPDTTPAQTCTDVPQATATELIEPCIWDSEEIAVLRRVFKSTSEENTRVRGRISVLHADVQKLSGEKQALGRSLESTQQRLHRATTANQRLQMMVNHLKTELDRTSKQYDHLRPVAKELKELRMQYQRLESELTTADCRRREELAAAEAEWLRVLEDQKVSDAATKAQLNGEVGSLVDRVEELEEALHQEKADHSRTRKGLEHLRVHFSSLPMSGEKSNAVHKDELVNWTY